MIRRDRRNICAMSEQVKFGEIDFEAIEYRNEYRHTKAVFACLAAQPYLLWYFLRGLFDNLWFALPEAPTSASSCS